MNRLVAVGRVAAPHGVRGWVKAEPLSGGPERLAGLGEIIVEKSGAGPVVYRIEQTGAQPKHALLKLAGIEDRDTAAKLSGASLYLHESELPELPEGEYYYYQLEGLKVVSEDGEPLGTLDYIGKTGSNDVYFILPPGGGEHRLAPALKKCIVSVDLEAGVMVLLKDWLV